MIAILDEQTSLDDYKPLYLDKMTSVVFKYHPLSIYLLKWNIRDLHKLQLSSVPARLTPNLTCMLIQTNFTNVQNITHTNRKLIKHRAKTLRTPKHNRNLVISEIDIKIHIFHRYFQYWCKTEDMMKHGVTNITNRKCNPNDVITLIKNLCQSEVEFYEKYGTNINVTNTSF